MMSTSRVLAFVSLIACGPAIAAAEKAPTDIYRCTLPNGHTVYQSAQCSAGDRQKAIDEKNARRELYRKQEEARRRQAK